jgi:multisubunit Na+/H+ antiporter MnhF subunit
MDTRERLTTRALQVVLAAALVTAPVFLFAEHFDSEHVWRVLASNGVVALLCGVLLAVRRRQRAPWVEKALVFGLLALVSTLAATNGEPIHANVINFVFVTVLAGLLLDRAGLLACAGLAAPAMIAITFILPPPAGKPDPVEARLESIAQFLPTYAVIVLLLWIQRGAAARKLTDAPPAA